ncbi:hypothetical protein FRC12_002275 [Ceratobasidium sp. 428]|nr:hypothetical protein FRC12_002275 [Ceratobasidium sp. 428]
MPNSSLDQKQLKALDELKQTLEQSGDYSPAKDGSDPSHSDATLIRFLRARRYSPTNAAQHFRTVEKWRTQHDVDNLYKTGFDLKEFEDMKKFYPRFTGRRDKVRKATFHYYSFNSPIVLFSVAFLYMCISYQL